MDLAREAQIRDEFANFDVDGSFFLEPGEDGFNADWDLNMDGKIGRYEYFHGQGMREFCSSAPDRWWNGQYDWNSVQQD